MTDTLVFIPAWNEEDNLPAVLDGLRAAIPDADVLVVDDGSTDGTAEVARAHGAEVHSLGVEPGSCVSGSLPDTAGRSSTTTRTAAEWTPTGSIRRPSSPVCSRSCAPTECDVAVGSRFVSGDGYAAYRYRPSPARAFGTALLRRAMKLVLRRPFGDATSGLYAVNAKALPLLAETFVSGAPEVEALIRVADAGLRLEEVPVTMAARASGESKLRGSKAVRLVITVVGTLVAARLLRSRRR